MKLHHTIWAALALATAGVTSAVAGPVTVTNELKVSQSAQSETDSGTQAPPPVNFDALGAAALAPYFETIGAGGNMTTVEVKDNKVHIRGDAVVPLPGSADFTNFGDADAAVTFVDSLTVVIPLTLDFQVAANGTFSAGLIQVNGSLFDATDPRGGASFGTGDVTLNSAFQSLSDFPASRWDAHLSLVPGDVYEIGYTLNVSVGSESSLSLGVIGNFADYSNTGGLIIQELSAGNAPVLGNPDIQFASGFDYTYLDVPEASAWTTGLAAVASLGFVRRRHQDA